MKGHVKVVGTLLQHGASVDIKDKVYLCVICTISASYTYNYHVSIVAATKSYVILTFNSFNIVIYRHNLFLYILIDGFVPHVNDSMGRLH